MTTLPRSAPPRPASTPPDCRHSRLAFDASFAVIAERTDLSPGAKLLHAKLVTLHRTGASWTQEQIGASLGTCRQNVWRWAGELVAAGLLLVVRLGQGRPNAYTLLGIPQEDLDGNAPKSRAHGSGHQDGRRPGQDRRDLFTTKNNERKSDYTHQRYGPKPPGSYLETRR